MCQVTNNIEWKKNRNLHTICLMDMILNNRFEEPYSRFAPESSLPLLSKTLVKSRLSNKFWKCTEKIYDDTNANKNKKYKTKITLLAILILILILIILIIIKHKSPKNKITIQTNLIYLIYKH